MKKCFLPLCLVILSGCSTPKIALTNQDVKNYKGEHCSKRAQEYLANYEYKFPAERTPVQKKLYEVIFEKSGKIEPCYIEHVHTGERYDVCVALGTDKKGVLSFIDIDDAQKPLSKALAKCLVDVYGSMNLKSFPNTKVMQGIILAPK